MKLGTLLLSSTLVAAPLAAAAQQIGFEGTASVGYSWSNGDLFDVDGLNIGLQSNILITPNFLIGFDLDAAWTDVDGLLAPAVPDTDVTRVAIEPTFLFGNGWEGSLYYQQAEFQPPVGLIPLPPGRVDLESYGIGAAYARANYRFAAYLGESDTDPGLPAGFDIKDWGISGSWAFDSGFVLSGQFAKSTIDTPAGDIDVELFALGGEYTLQNGLMLFGAVGQTDISGPGASGDATQVSVGLGYDLSRLPSGIPAVATIELAHTNVNVPIVLPASPDQTKVTVGLTFALGGGKAGVPLDSGARLAKGDVRSAIAASGLGFF